MGLAAGGVILTGLTAGPAAPAAVACGTIFGRGLAGAVVQFGMHLVKDSGISRTVTVGTGAGAVVIIGDYATIEIGSETTAGK